MAVQQFASEVLIKNESVLSPNGERNLLTNFLFANEFFLAFLTLELTLYVVGCFELSAV